MNVEESSLRSRMNRGFRFIDSGCYAMKMENTGKCEATESGQPDIEIR